MTAPGDRGDRGGSGESARREARLAWLLCGPAVATIAAVALFPLLYTLWESLHLHDLRMPWRGRPFVGLGNYAEALGDARLAAAFAKTLGFALISVALELLLGLGLALLLHGRFIGRSAARAVSLLPWALPTVVAALLWKFAFEAGSGSSERVWLGDPLLAWVPILLADVWKATPFVALIVLSGLAAIDPRLYDAARVDGAGRLACFVHITLPGLRPALLTVFLFRMLDALRIFDLIYVLSGGGPGTATEPLALYTFQTLLQNLRFGYGAALSMLVFATTALFAFFYLRRVGRSLLEQQEREGAA